MTYEEIYDLDPKANTGLAFIPMEQYVIFIDTQIEKDNEVGRAYNLPALGPNEVHLPKKFAQTNGLKSGDYIYLEI